MGDRGNGPLERAVRHPCRYGIMPKGWKTGFLMGGAFGGRSGSGGYEVLNCLGYSFRSAHQASSQYSDLRGRINRKVLYRCTNSAH